MAGDPRTKAIISAERLNNAGREELLCQLDELQAAVGCEWSKRMLEDRAKDTTFFFFLYASKLTMA
jgi:hypothetical protein